MADTTEQLILDLKARDNASKPLAQLANEVVKAKREVAALSKETKALDTAMRKGEDVTSDLVKSTVELEKARLRAKNAESDFRAELNKTAVAQKEAADNARLFGDVESRTRAITGGIGFVGGGLGQGIERNINIGAEVLASAEAIGLLKQELPQLAANLGVTKGNVGLLAAELGILGAALVIGKTLLSDIVKGADAAKVAIVGQIDGLKEYYDFIGGATTEDLRNRLEELAARRDINAQLLQDLTNIQLAIDQGLDATGPGAERLAGNLLKVGDALGVMDFGADDVQEAINSINAEMKSADVQFRLLTAAFGEGATAANDAAAREREYTAAKIDSLEREARVRTEAANMTEEQVDKQLAAIAAETAAKENELAALQGLAQNEQVVAQIETVNNRLSELSEEARLLDTVARPLAQANDAVASASKAASDAVEQQAKNTDLLNKVYQSAAAQSAKYADDLAAFEEKRLQSAEDYAAKTTEIEQNRDLKLVQEAEKFALDQVNALADHYQEMAELDQAYYADRAKLLDDLQSDLNDLDFGLSEDLAALKDDLTGDLKDLTQQRLDALKQYNTDATRAAEDHYKRLGQIQDRAQNDIRSAALRLDAVRIYEAKAQAEEQLKIEQDQYETDQQRREEDFRDQLQAIARERRERLQAYKEAEQDLRKRYDRERAERIDAYRKDLADLTRAHAQERAEKEKAFQTEQARTRQRRQLELQQQQAQWALEDQQRNAQRQREIALEGQHYSRLLTLTTDGLYQVELAYQNWLQSMAATTTASAINVTTGSGNTITNDLGFASGGFPPLNRDVMVGERGPEIVRFRQPARVYPNGQRPSAMDGAQVNINVYDTSGNPRQTAYLTRREFETVINRSR